MHLKFKYLLILIALTLQILISRRIFTSSFSFWRQIRQQKQNHFQVAKKINWSTRKTFVLTFSRRSSWRSCRWAAWPWGPWSRPACPAACPPSPAASAWWWRGAAWRAGAPSTFRRWLRPPRKKNRRSCTQRKEMRSHNCTTNTLMCNNCWQLTSECRGIWVTDRCQAVRVVII